MISRLEHIPFLSALIKRLAKPDDTILDVGCGRLRNGMRQVLGERYKGLDLATRPEDKDYVGDAEALDFPDNSFDVVTAFSVVEHLKNPFIGVSEMARVARRYVLLTTDLYLEDANRDPTHLYCWTPKVFKQFLALQNRPIHVWDENAMLCAVLKKTLS